MSLRFHEIAESNHRILNPFTEDKLMLVGEICHIKSDMRQLDLCCGKGEMLCQWARRWGIQGVGVDISAVFLAAARERALEMGVTENLTLIEGDAGKYVAEVGGFDIVSCIGATWIGGGLVGTLKLMLPALKPGGLILVGEPYWITPPPDEVYAAMEVGKDEFASLRGTLDRIESVGLELVEMVLADGDSWDRYVAAQWMALDTWLRANIADADAPALREWNAHWKRIYLEYERPYFGWGVFVLKVK
jgi:SAM-dependent methyltransferase